MFRIPNRRSALGGVLTAIALVAPLVGAPAIALSPEAAAETADHPWIGEPAPGFSLPDVDGRPIRLEDLRGSMVVIHFGASW